VSNQIRNSSWLCGQYL